MSVPLSATRMDAGSTPRDVAGSSTWKTTGMTTPRKTAKAMPMDLALGPPPSTRARLAIRAPAAGAVLAGGVVPTLEVDATGATIDGREVAACYAVLDRKCCALLWTAPGPLRADDALPADAAPVFERLDLPPGDHELVAWLEHANGTLVAFDSVRFGVVGAVS